MNLHAIIMRTRLSRGEILKKLTVQQVQEELKSKVELKYGREPQKYMKDF